MIKIVSYIFLDSKTIKKEKHGKSNQSSNQIVNNGTYYKCKLNTLPFKTTECYYI